MELTLIALLSPLVGGRVFPDVAPIGTARPYITWQQFGGDVIKPLANEVASKRNSTVQINVWSDTRLQANQLILQAETALVTSSAFIARPISAFAARHEEDVDLYGAEQDFSIWSDR
ncbi:MAG: DUF3168 domain-containing protein [Alcaligenaceae bacterium]|nr:DUF3168 domain-containing protein [Alcaligenaceae bacterium]